MPGVLKDSSSRARALARKANTEISRNAFLGIFFFLLKSAHSIYQSLSLTIKAQGGDSYEKEKKIFLL